MSYLKTKSDVNQMAAALLQKNSHYASVVHCSYYSCLQLMKHIVINTLGISEQQIETDLEYKGGSHTYLINKITTYLQQERKDSRVFSSSITQLRRMRNTADYENIQVDSTIGGNSITLSETIITHLKSNIKI